VEQVDKQLHHQDEDQLIELSPYLPEEQIPRAFFQGEGLPIPQTLLQSASLI
jgi:hypothetical protein